MQLISLSSGLSSGMMTNTASSTFHLIFLAFIGAAFCQCGVSVNMLTTAPEDSESSAQTDSGLANDDTFTENSSDFPIDASDENDSVVPTDTFGESDSSTAIGLDTGTVTENDTGDDTEIDTNSSDRPESDTGTNDFKDSDSASSPDTEEDTTVTSEECQKGEVRPSQVLIIGDAWIGHEVAENTLHQLARENDALGENEKYVNLTANGAPIEAIMQQYVGYADDDVKLVVMNGGGINTYSAQASAVANGGNQYAIDEAIGNAASDVIDAFADFLNDLYIEGSVENVIYAMYPDVDSTPGIQEMRPGMRDACENSSVTCHFLNLEDFWINGVHNGSSAELLPNDTGNELIGQKIWETMADNCIAQ